MNRVAEKPSLGLFRYVIAIGIVGLVAMPVGVRAYHLRTERMGIDGLRTQLRMTRERQQRMQRMSSDTEATLASLADRGWTSGSQEELRSHWLDVVHRHRGKLRRLDLSEPVVRHWGGDGDTIRSEIYFDVEPSGFLLHRIDVVLHVEGSRETLEKILRDVLTPGPLAHIEQLSVSSRGSVSGQLHLQMEMQLFGLSEDDGSLDEDYASDVRPRDPLRGLQG